MNLSFTRRIQVTMMSLPLSRVVVILVVFPYLRHSGAASALTSSATHNHRALQRTFSPNVGVSLDLSCVDKMDSGGDEVFRVTLSVAGAGGSSTVPMPMDVIFALDSSGSMSFNDPGEIRMVAAKSFVDRMDYSRDKVGVVSWDDNIDFIQSLSNEFVLVKNKIDDVDSSGGTDLNVGLYKAITLLDANARNEQSMEAIIYLTDGNGTYIDCINNGPAAHARSKNYTIFTIGLGTSANATALQDMASCTGGAYYQAPTAANIHAVFDLIFQQITSSSSPHNIDVNAVVHSCHSIDPWSITPTPILANGQTIVWSAIDAGAGLEAGQVLKLSFEAKSSCGGMNVDIFDPLSNVTYTSFDYDNSVNSTQRFQVSFPRASINVNIAPIAECKESWKQASTMCQACFDANDVDNGSFDLYTCPVNEAPILNVSWDPNACFDLGSHEVSMTATDAWGLSSTCYTNVTVVDTIAPLISCNLPDGFIPSYVPLEIVPTALDNCPVTLEITGYECWMAHNAEKRLRNENCIVSIHDDRLTATIIDSGGAGNNIHLLVKATDSSGNVQEETCVLQVLHPDHRHGD